MNVRIGEVQTVEVGSSHRRGAGGAVLTAVLVILLAWLSPLRAAAPGDNAAPQVPDTLQQRIAACTSCHGVHGEGSPGSGFFPRLAGKPAGYLARQLMYFHDGLRKFAPMEYMVRSLSPAYMREIAEYFTAQLVPYQRSQVPHLPATTLQRGEQLVTQGDPALKVPACERCHGKSLTGVEPDIPGLVGLPYDYISSQLGSWRTGTRAAAAPDCMSEIANRLTPTDISAVAAWLATRQLPADTHALPAGSVTPPLVCGVLAGKGGDGT
jgi:cytochrome c553